MQEAFLRLHRAEQEGERDRVAARVPRRRWSPGWRSTSCARRGRGGRRYVGEWLPEPLLADAEDDPARQAEMADSLSLAFLVLLESLSPRAAGRVPAARGVRLPLRRDRRDRRHERGQRAAAGGAGAPPRRGAPAALRRLARAARASWPTASSPPPRRATCAALEALLAQDVALHGDGGGKVPALARAAARPRARGAHAASPGCARRRGSAACSIRPRRGQRPARRDGCSTREGRLVGVMALDIADGQIQAIRSIVNPDKLRHLGRAGRHGSAARGPAEIARARRCCGRSRSARDARCGARPALERVEDLALARS